VPRIAPGDDAGSDRSPRTALGVEGIVGQEGEPLLLLFAAAAAADPLHLDLEIDTDVADIAGDRGSRQS
jgi:hypothetical protein